ncbi:hypothetical protein [Candidatus Poriferisodalis sp.]|uniref:hypothetical protein n=1 Tax=Candidatus Poriferisodalis sp. TaxID=3101277 RepID=UPI003B01331A
MRATRRPGSDLAYETPASPAQQSPSPWQRFRSQLGLGIAWLVAYVLVYVLVVYVIEYRILGRTNPISDHVIVAASILTGILVAMGLMELWRRGREAEAAD